MSSKNVVSQPTALAMKEAGWVKETHGFWRLDQNGDWFVMYVEQGLSKAWKARHPTEWLPAPNVTEIVEELTYEDLGKYFCVVVDPELREFPITTLGNFCKWLYSIMHDANELAKVWLWKQGKEAK